MKAYFGPARLAAVSRELTKMFEETRRDSLEQLAAHYTQHAPKGEIVIVVEGRQPVSKKASYKTEEED